LAFALPHRSSQRGQMARNPQQQRRRLRRQQHRQHGRRPRPRAKVPRTPLLRRVPLAATEYHRLPPRTLNVLVVLVLVLVLVLDLCFLVRFTHHTSLITSPCPPFACPHSLAISFLLPALPIPRIQWLKISAPLCVCLRSLR